MRHRHLSALAASAAALVAVSARAQSSTSFGAPAAPGTQEAEPQAPKPTPRPEERASPKAAANGTRLPAAVPTGTVVWPHDPALAALEAERDALEMVDHSARLGVEESSRRIGAMHAFIDRNDLESRWSQFSRGYVPTLDQLTFDEAVARAKSHGAGDPPAPATNDVDHLEQAIAVEAGVARNSWNLLNRNRRAVDALTAFLLKEDLLDDYMGWAPGFMRSMGWKPTPPAPGTAPDPDAVRKRGVQLEWDRAQRERRAQAPAAPAIVATQLPGGAPPAVPVQNGTVPAPVDLGASPARSIYSNSWWNGYADPYYDTCGFPGRDPNLSTAMADDPKTYGYAPEAYTYRAWPMFWDLGPNAYPAYGMFPGGAAGGVGFGGAVGGAGFGGAVGGGR